MKNVLGIVASPKINGNVDKLVSRVLEGVKEEDSENQTEKINLYEINLNFCQACHHCSEEYECSVDDDIKVLAEKFLKADGLILGSPVIWGYLDPKMVLAFCRLRPYLFKKHSDDHHPVTALDKKIRTIMLSACSDASALAVYKNNGVFRQMEKFLHSIGSIIMGKYMFTNSAHKKVEEDTKTWNKLLSMGKEICFT